MKLYPLKFNTIYKDKIWGGEKIRTVLGKDYGDLPNCGETWELSGVKGDVSVVKNGSLSGLRITDLIDRYKEELLGNRIYDVFGVEFPLLIKFIDANADLSVQVHPDNEMAAKRHGCKGKTEMWYVLQADEGAKLISGFNKPIDRETYLEQFKAGKLMEILNEVDVYKDDVFFLPAGRVHTIGKGNLIAEIQQTSDITYRIYDFERTDAAGNQRELHVDEALDAIDYTHYDNFKTEYKTKLNEVTPLVSCQYFVTNKLSADKALNRDLQSIDSFKIYICLDGGFEIKVDDSITAVSRGEVVLVPACIKNYGLLTSNSFTALETYIGN